VGSRIKPVSSIEATILGVQELAKKQYAALIVQDKFFSFFLKGFSKH